MIRIGQHFAQTFIERCVVFNVDTSDLFRGNSNHIQDKIKETHVVAMVLNQTIYITN